ncbi:MAG: hypothetical protein C4576_19350 [Desulfobacteraceae bacterium]|nr:MAG: hypothetical protein C4576_19350 [Desulfobacteraceae bacterium]
MFMLLKFITGIGTDFAVFCHTETGEVKPIMSSLQARYAWRSTRSGFWKKHMEKIIAGLIACIVASLLVMFL